jgi:glutathione synthase/RimK-type ligase-like ATP-grasp enzyme
MHRPDITISSAARESSRVALVTCAPMNGLDPDDALTLAPLRERGIHAEPAVWDDPAVDWAAYDLAVVRSTWDYYPRRDEFLAWAGQVPRLANPAAVLAWNTDKRYLRELAAAGVPTTPTTWIGPGEAWTPPVGGEVVVKPAVSGGGIDTGRYDLADPHERQLAAKHARRLADDGRLVMVQPYLAAVDEHGETALLWLGGRYSHAIRKGALLTGPDVGVQGLYREEEIAAREPSPEQIAVAERVLAAVPFDPADLLYARVDLVPDGAGAPLLLEIELTEPSLFLATAPGAPERFADGVAAHISRTGR